MRHSKIIWFTAHIYEIKIMKSRRNVALSIRHEPKAHPSPHSYFSEFQHPYLQKEGDRLQPE